jgi:outer membrane protein OmpU
MDRVLALSDFSFKRDTQMKRILATTTILALSAGFASAEVTLSGDARMGIIGGDGVDTAFTSRARVKFSMSGETDGGIAFGASFRADNAEGAASGTAGSVYISGAFGKLTMGDIDGAAQQAVGNVDGVGLTGLGDLNETFYAHNYVGDGDDIDPTAAYEYSTGAFTGIMSVSNPGAAVEVLALGAKYATDTFSVALGYESEDTSFDNVILGGSATFGAVTLKANYSVLDTTFAGVGLNSYHVSATYTADALAVTGFYSNEDELFEDGGPGASGYGIGASYDLGGGASVVGGYAKNQSTDDSAFDLGLSFSF